MNRKRLAILLIISVIFSFVQIPESAQAETEQGELTAQSQYQASNITKPLNIKYKDRQGVLYTLNDRDLTAKVASDNRSCDFSDVDGVYEIPAKVTFKGKEYVVREVEERAFYRVSTLKEIIIPDTVVTIGDFAFSTSSLNVLSLGMRVKNMNRSAFLEASCQIYINENNPFFKFVGDVLYDMGEMSVVAYFGSEEKDSFVIMDGTKSVGPYAFQDAKIDKVYLPDTVECLKKYAFSYCTMRFLDTSHVKRMEAYCLKACSNLQNICLGKLSYLERWNGSAIQECNNVKNVYIEENSIDLGSNLDVLRNIQSIIVEKGNSFTAGFANNQNLKYLIIPDTCKTFSCNFLWKASNLTKLYMPESIATLKWNDSSGATTSHYTTTWCAKSDSTAAKFAQEKGFPYQNIDEHTHELASTVFYEDEFIKVKGQYCEECGYGTDTSYEWKELAKYPKEQSPTLAPTTAPDVDEIVQLDDEGKDKYGIPYIMDDTTHTATAGAEGWDDYVYQGENDGVVELPAYVQKGNDVYSVTKVGDFLFEDNEKLQSLTIPDTYVQIGENAIGGSGIKHLYIGKNLKTITNNTLGRMDNLEEVVLDEKNGCYLMWNGAMYTTDLTHLIVWSGQRGGACFVPTTVERIEDYAFASSKITGVYFQAREKNDKIEVAANSFINCEKLSWAWFNGPFCYEGKCLFQGCSGLETILYDQNKISGSYSGFHLANMLEKHSSVKNLVLFNTLPYPLSNQIYISKLQNLLMPDVVHVWNDFFCGIDFSTLKKLYISKEVESISVGFRNATSDFLICSESEKAKNFAETKGFSYMDLSEHTHNLQEMVFFEDDTCKVSCQYCEECAYSEGFIAKNKMTGVEMSVPTATPSASPVPATATPSATATVTPSATPTVTPPATASAKPSTSPEGTPDSATPTPSATVKPSAAPVTQTPAVTATAKPGTTPTVTPPATASAKPTPSPTSSNKPSAAPTSTPKATASGKPSTSPAVKPTPKNGISNQTAAPSATSAADDSPGQDLPGKSVKPPAWKRIYTKDNRSIILQWKMVSGAKTYKIYRSEKEKGKYTKIGNVSASKCLLRDRKVKAGRTYYYKIQADNGAFSSVKKYAVNGMTAPEVTVRKKGAGRNVYLEFRVKKYKGKYVEIYMKKKNKFVRISLSENNIKKYKGKMKLRCLLKNKTLSFKVRTFDKKKKAKKYSVYSKILTVKV